MPSSLHEAAARAAAAEGVSLNLFICTTVARAVEWEKPAMSLPGEARRKRDAIQWDLWVERRGSGR